MRNISILAILAVFFAGFGFSVARMESLRANGADAFLALEPVDPRALLMGDYMALEYAVNDAIRDALWRKYGTRPHSGPDDAENAPSDGRAVIKRTAPEAAFPAVAFVRLDDGAPLAPDEMPLAFKVRGRRIITAAPAFYFQEGNAGVYEGARYGRVKIDGKGKTLLVALCDGDARDIVPEKKE
jgi:uncharacterized membrane-anchored protein